jgi:hypothetical protein
MGVLDLFGLGSGPPKPDFTAAANKQTQQNRPNTSTNWNSQTWTQGPDGRPMLTQGATGEAANAFANLQHGMNQASQMDPMSMYQNAFNGVYNQQTARLDPMWSQRENAFDAKMANQGLSPGMEAQNNASRNFGQARNDAYGQAFQNAFGMGNQAVQTQLAINKQPFDEYASLVNSTNTAPHYNAPGNYQQAAQDQYGADLNSYNAGQAGLENLIGAGTKLGSTLMGGGGAGSMMSMFGLGGNGQGRSPSSFWGAKNPDSMYSDYGF